MKAKRQHALPPVWRAVRNFCAGDKTGANSAKISAAATARESHGDSRDNGDGATDNQPHGAIGWIPCERARDIRSERMRLIETEDQQHDAERKNSQTYDVVHDISFCPRVFPEDRPQPIGTSPILGGKRTPIPFAP